jgi:hypothetical protein
MITDGIPAAVAIGRYSIAPAAAFVTAGVMRRDGAATRRRLRPRSRRAHDRAQILWVRDTVERDEKRTRRGEERLDAGGLDRVGVGDDTLRHLGGGKIVELLAGDVLNRDAPTCRVVGELGEIGRLPRRNPYGAHATAPRRERTLTRWPCLSL